MKIMKLTANNINDLTVDIDSLSSIAVGGLSGSGKSTFCATLYAESTRRIISLLPKSEYRFLFPDCLSTNHSANNIEKMPLIFYLRKNGFASNPRSTIGTHSGLFKKIRIQFADKYGKASEFFSFNNSIMWCPDCKGRGSSSGVECKSCKGTRYSDTIREYTLSVNKKEMNIIDINNMTMKELLDNSEYFNFDEIDIKKISNAVNLGLPYLSLERVMSTLSGGETLRILLSEFMASCDGALVILDEISTGLDKFSLLQVLKEISTLAENNQVWFIDHSDMVLYSSGKQIYFGPGSGDNGGNIVQESPRPAEVYPEKSTIVVNDYYCFKNLSKRNIELESLMLPKGAITAITGESGCGKSTLVNECILPYFRKNYKSVALIVIGQDRNQSITSKSTISSFLDIKKYLKKYDTSYYNLSLAKACEALKKDKSVYSVLKMLVDLGLDYLTLDRKIQTLSTGEFQCIHLVSKIFELEKKEMVIVLDEPSKGLSQNILNLLMRKIRSILSDYNATILIIEHNEYVLNCSDYIIDFGKRTNEKVTVLDVKKNQEWSKTQKKYTVGQVKVPSMLLNKRSGIVKVSDNVDDIYSDYENCFKGGILKSFSSTAQWIYKEFSVKQVRPIIAIDFEKRLYSENTFLFEIASAINSIISLGKTEQYDKFDFYDPDNLCECCKGTGKIETYSYEKMFVNNAVGLWDGLLNPEVMKELKRYNYSKIKFLFKEIMKESGLNLSKPFDDMSEMEKKTFLYGYWKNTFYDTTKKTQRRWYGILHLISKYMRSSSSDELKAVIKETSTKITCPICSGKLLNHDTPIEFEYGNLNDILSKSIDDNSMFLKKIPRINEIVDIVGGHHCLMDDVSLFSYETQVRLKLLELSCADFWGFEIALKNLAPYTPLVEKYLKNISENNKVVLLDWDNISETKEELLCKLSKHKIKKNSFAYELLGYKKISTAINGVKKKNPCPYCHGKGILCEESIFEGVDVTRTPCTSCNMTGINDIGLNVQVEGVLVSLWMTGTLYDVNPNLPDYMQNIKLYSKIGDLNKRQINSILFYLGEK